jgi:Arc/MetJ family transcription regulator
MHYGYLNAIINVSRNPWGKGKKGNWEGPWSDGSKEFTPEAQKELNHKFGNDSVFWISFEDLLRKYQHFDRTRLFMDSPDWRVSQKWISVEVPWHAEFEQKFRIVLKKESPVVLVLSQLDDRYFDGLQGQYSFRLQFRLHEVDSPGENDYIVRSHGNYLMERSVVTELKSLKAGTYSVFVMVAADRDTNMSSVEDVIKDQCRGKIDNDKLARVGMAYDLAHRKGAVHIASRAAARQAREKAKAREARMAARRRNWEKTHLTRNVLRKQYKKNQEKREKREKKEQKTPPRHGGEARERPDRRRRDMPFRRGYTNESTFEQEDKAVQTEDPLRPPAPETRTLEPRPVNENDKGVQTEEMSASFIDSQDPLETPESGLTSPPPRRLPIDPHEGPLAPGPPYDQDPLRRRSLSPRRGSRDIPRRNQYITSEGDSSASPISDFEDLYSDDDPTLRPRRMNPGESRPRSTHKKSKESDDEEPDPWNAVCIVGIRVYSQDEGLDITVFEEDFEDLVKPKAVKEEDAGTDADVEDSGDEELERKSEAKKPKDGVVVGQGEGDTGVKHNDEEKTQVPNGTSKDKPSVVDAEMKALELNREESILSTNGGVELLENTHPEVTRIEEESKLERPA